MEADFLDNVRIYVQASRPGPLSETLMGDLANANIGVDMSDMLSDFA